MIDAKFYGLINANKALDQQFEKFFTKASDALSTNNYADYFASILKSAMADPNSQIYRQWVLTQQAENDYAQLYNANVSPETLKQVISTRDQRLETLSLMISDAIVNNEMLSDELNVKFEDLHRVESQNKSIFEYLQEKGLSKADIKDSLEQYLPVARESFRIGDEPDEEKKRVLKQDCDKELNFAKSTVANKIANKSYIQDNQYGNEYAELLYLMCNNQIRKNLIEVYQTKEHTANTIVNAFKNELYLYNPQENAINKDALEKYACEHGYVTGAQISAFNNSATPNSDRNM